MQGFYRCGTYASAASQHAAGTEKLNTLLYANAESTPLVSIFEDAGKNYNIGVKTSQGYVPDNMEQAASYFRMNLYPNKLVAHVGDDGILKIGLKKTTTVTSDWTIFDNFTLQYLGANDPTAISHTKADCSATSKAYTLSGYPAPENYHGIEITNGTARVVK